MQENRKLLQKSFQQAGFFLSEDQENAFLRYARLLEEWNSRINLTAITEFEEVVHKHFLDSVYPFLLLKPQGVTCLLDMGSGAGFPGIPLKIMFPALEITLLDSLNKRVLFLNEVINSLKLEKIKAMHGRAEDLGKNKLYREQFDLVTARAVAPMRVLAEYCLPFARVGGSFWAYKSENMREELQLAQRAIGLLGAEALEPTHYTLPGAEAGRSLIICHKIKESPSSYPRRAGSIAKKPL